MYQLTFYVPASHLEQVKNALFDAGAGRLNGYDRCAWQTAGQGQFRALPGSQPYIGASGQLATVDEFKVEMICKEVCIQSVLQALLASHPYEQPAYAVIPILMIDELSL